MGKLPQNHGPDIFTEAQRDDVCKGKLCPKCLGNNIINVGHNFDGMNANMAYDCNECGAQWEGY